MYLVKVPVRFLARETSRAMASATLRPEESLSPRAELVEAGLGVFAWQESMVGSFFK